MTARSRTYLLVGLAAVAAAGFVIAIVALTRTSPGPVASAQAQTTRRGPALALDLGVRTDPEAIALRRANRLYSHGKRRAAGRIFARYRSVDAQVGAAVAAWPDGTVARLERLAAEYPASGVVELHLGLAEVASGDTPAAEKAWRRALKRDPDSTAAVQAESLLYPRYAPGRPPFVPSYDVSPAIQRLSPPLQVAALARDAQRPSVRAKLLYGAALQRLGRPVSAEQQFSSAARLAPDDAEALVAAAVGRFSKASPAVAFSQLGPLASRFPHSQSVRFHLGELLLWIGQVDKARQELRLAVAEDRSTILGKSASAFLSRLPR